MVSHLYKSTSLCCSISSHELLSFQFDKLSSQHILISLHVDLSQLCIINNFKGTKAAKLGSPLSSVMTNELSLRLYISLSPLWLHPREQAAAVPSCEQVSPNRWQGNRMEMKTIGFCLNFIWAICSHTNGYIHLPFNKTFSNSNDDVFTQNTAL